MFPDLQRLRFSSYYTDVKVYSRCVQHTLTSLLGVVTRAVEHIFVGFGHMAKRLETLHL